MIQVCQWLLGLNKDSPYNSNLDILNEMEHLAMLGEINNQIWMNHHSREI